MIQIESGATDTDKPMVLIENLLADGSITASTEATNAEAENAVDGATFDFWTPTALPATWEVELSAPDSADAFAIAAHNLGSTGCTIFLETFNGSTWDEIATQTPTDDSTILFLFPSTSDDRWRLRITGSTVPSIGHMALGLRMILPGIVGDYAPTNWSPRVEIMGGQTQSGQFLGQRVMARGAATTVFLGRVARSWFAATGVTFQAHYNDGRPFFFAGWPSNLPGDIALCWRGERSQEIQATITERDWVILSFDVNAYVAA